MFRIGGDGDSRGPARDKAQNPHTPKISFLLGFRPLYLGNIGKIKNKKDEEKIQNYPERLGAPTLFPFDCAGGGRYQKTLMVATISRFLAISEDRVSLEI